MGLFRKDTENTESIYFNNITFNQSNIFIKNGFSKKTIPIKEISSYGISYGLRNFCNEEINKGKNMPGGLERFFSGAYNVEIIPSISIFIKTKNNKYTFYPLTIGKTKKGRTLIIAEEIFDKLEGVIKDVAEAT